MCVNVFLVVKGFLMLIWVMVEVDVCVSVCDRPVPAVRSKVDNLLGNSGA